MNSKKSSQVIQSKNSMTSTNSLRTSTSHTASNTQTIQIPTVSNKSEPTVFDANKTKFDTFTNKSFKINDKNENNIDLKPFNAALQHKAQELEDGLFKKVAEANSGLKTSLKDALEDIDTHKNETREELKETRNSVLGTIALFAGFFTFVSVNVNIFTKAESVNQSIIFMLCFWLCIIGFITLFFLFLNKNKETNLLKTIELWATVVCIALSALLVSFLFKDKNNESYVKINAKLTKIQQENEHLKKENTELNNKLDKQLGTLEEQVIELRKNQYQLNHQ